MNTTTRTATVAVMITAFAVGGVVTSPAAQARENRFAEHVAWGSPYAEPNPAIGGRTMAEYVRDHVEHRIQAH